MTAIQPLLCGPVCVTFKQVGQSELTFLCQSSGTPAWEASNPAVAGAQAALTDELALLEFYLRF